MLPAFHCEMRSQPVWWITVINSFARGYAAGSSMPEVTGRGWGVSTMQETSALVKNLASDWIFKMRLRFAHPPNHRYNGYGD